MVLNQPLKAFPDDWGEGSWAVIVEAVYEVFLWDRDECG